MQRLRLAKALAVAVLFFPRASAAAPLDLANTTARAIRVEIESSADLAVVGTSFGSPIPASYSVTGGFGTVVIAGGDYEFYVGSSGFDSSDIVFRIELATRAAELVSANGTWSLPPFGGYSFLWSMDSSRTSGFVDATSSFPPLHCTSQAQIDALCPTIPQLCGATCVIVAGAAYDPATGKLNMVGFEHQDGCSEAGCTVIDVFNPNGDLRLSEAPPSPAVPATGPLALLALVAGLLLSGSRRLAARSHAGVGSRH